MPYRTLVKQKGHPRIPQSVTGWAPSWETGTYLGDMVEVQLHEFDKVISIELSQDLYDRARLRSRRNPNVQLHRGDGGKVWLHKVVPALKEPALFWLDGHYSHGITARGEKDCPIFEELDLRIFKNGMHGHNRATDRQMPAIQAQEKY